MNRLYNYSINCTFNKPTLRGDCPNSGGIYRQQSRSYCYRNDKQLQNVESVQLGQVSSKFAAAKNGQVSSNFVAAKNGQVSSKCAAAENCPVSSKFAAAKNGQDSRIFAAAKNGQVSSKFAAVKMVNFLLPNFQVSSKNGKLFVADFYLAASASVNDANHRKPNSFITPMTRDMGRNMLPAVKTENFLSPIFLIFIWL